MRKLILMFITGVFSFLVTGVRTPAQSTGSVRGVVSDPQGAAVADAKLTLKNLETNVTAETTTNGNGLYVFAYVKPGTYDLSIKRDGFRSISSSGIPVAVAQVISLDFTLDVGNISETVTVTESTAAINTTNAELGFEVTRQQLTDLPLLDQNYYNLVALTPGAADAGSVSGDVRGMGLAIGGNRTSSVNYMLDGASNNDTFVTGVAQLIPLDAVREFRVQTNNATAEFGRNPVVTNVVSRSGSNDYHGSLYELYRGAALSSSNFDDNAHGTPKSNFVRNQFGGSFGGALIKDKLFYFGSFEGIRVRSSANNGFLVPTQAFFNNASSATTDYLNTYGGLLSSNCGDVAVSAQYIWNTTEGNAGTVTAYGNPSSTVAGNVYGLFPASTALSADGSGPSSALIPASTNLFCRDVVRGPTDAGGGVPQDTWLATGRVDYQFSANTSFYARYAYANTNNPVGAGSISPYPGFSTPATSRNQNIVLSLSHTFSPSLVGELRGTYDRVNPFAPLGSAPGTAPCWQYNQDLSGITPNGERFTMPGYLPAICLGAGLDVGGPQNVYEASGSLTWTRGKHTLRFGGSYFHMRHNHRFGAYEDGFYNSATMQDLLDGSVDFLAQAYDPRGRVPGDTYSTAVDGPFEFPNFTRHYRYNELSGFVMDTLKLSSRLTFTLGTRYEYFGVQYSPANEKLLDANFYFNAVGGVDTNIYEAIRDGRFRRTNQFYKPNYNDWAPRAGLAYDLFGNGRTVFRAGYGLYYDRNFGNATFNAIQNPPNYAVITGSTSDFFGGPLTIKPNEFDMLAENGGTLTVSSSARMLDNDLRTASSQQWNATFEHNFFGKDIIGSVGYVGSRGDHLYSLNNLNQRGSCLLLLQISSGPCSGAGPGASSYRINRSGVTGLNRRGNEGLSRYNSLQASLRTQEIGRTGLTLYGSYTWSHSIDNESSFFGDSAFDDFFGFTNPFNPAADRSSSINDFRHRFTLSGIWNVPVFRKQSGLAGRILGGWSIASIFSAQTGGAFPVYDGSATGQCIDSSTDQCYPVLIPGQALPKRQQTVSVATPNTVTLYDFSASGAFMNQADYCARNTLSTPMTAFGNAFGGGASEAAGYTAAQDDYACTAALINLYPNLEAPRSLFRTPGLWNLDAAIRKDFNLPREGHQLQFRADFINAFNHANLYVNPSTIFFSSTGAVTAERGVPNSGGKERRNIELTLRYTF
jgi:hypothetical protein